MNKTIFVHIISYRDPELSHTIASCLRNAVTPSALRFGIVWQHGPEETQMQPYLNDPRFRVLDVPASEAKGCCWARAQAQGLYQGEDFVLQLDSHHRFAPGWDLILQEMLEMTGSARPMLTSYASGYDAEKGKHDSIPLAIRLRPFSPDGSLMFYGAAIPQWQNLTKPVKARIASGHFMFTLGRHCTDVPYDPDLYFLGEELVMAARSYTHGYDMFHPHRTVLWHQYTRENRVKIWDDKPAMHNERDRISRERVLQLMGAAELGHDLGIYGLGRERTLDEFQDYVGVDFKNRLQHQSAIDGVEPPTPMEPEHMVASTAVLMQWGRELEMPENMAHVLYTVEAASGKVLWRREAGAKDDFLPPRKALVADKQEPARIMVWPHVSADGKTVPGPVRYNIPLQKEVVYHAG